MSKKDYYEVLGVEKSISSTDLKKAYYKLAKKYHPDSNPNDKAAVEKYKVINEAYDILKDEQKRKAYDSYGHNAFGQGGQSNQGGFHADINDIFGDFFNDFMGNNRGQGSSSRSSSSQIKGSDLKYNLTITLAEAFTGISKNITINIEAKCNGCQGSGSEDNNGVVTCDTCSGRGATRMRQGPFVIDHPCNKCAGAGHIIKNPCKKCRGQGRSPQQKVLTVNIPSGIENGTRATILYGEGEAGIRGGKAGDLHIFVVIEAHKIFKVEGSNIHFKLPISFTKAALGGEMEVPSIDGSKILLKIPAGTQNSEQLRLKEKGMSRLRSSSRGDMFAHVHIETPKELTKKQRELLEAYAKEFGEQINEEGSFFDKVKNIWS
ncbi:MAG: molecular chaperone DnaJ [Rickettsiaceae bacterium]|nr:MAG: molecular chaperone DnaJ [Rickettsiaceae bacterium]